MRHLKVLISAYACSPYTGSEPGMGWGWVEALSKYHDLWVITEKDEFESDIEAELCSKPEIRKRIRFFYIPRKHRRILRKIWPPSYYWTYKAWQKKAYRLAKTLHGEINFDLVHQLNMIGYREPGYLWNLNIPFVWGPIGGHAQMPWQFMMSLGIRDECFYACRNIVNTIQMATFSRVNKAMNCASALVAATGEDLAAIKRFQGRTAVLINETGTKIQAFNKSKTLFNGHRPLRICWCGGFAGCKALPLALYALQKIRSYLDFEFHIVGDGPNNASWRKVALKLGVSNLCHWHGKVEHKEAMEIMSASDVLLFTSLQEGTPHVVLESLISGTPVICHDACGFGEVIDDSCGIKIPLCNPRKSIDGFAQAITKISMNPYVLAKLSKNAIERAKAFSWDKKAKQMSEIYYSVVNQE